MPRRGRATIAALLLAAIMLVLAVPAVAGAAGSSVVQQPEEDPDGDPSTDDEPVPDRDIIPEPDSGRPARDAGDRGGVLQGVVLLFIVIGVGIIATLVVRESRRGRARRVRASDDDAVQANSP
ncbi:MAG TPA: hypothetical protein VE623_02950 [Acidimicrobiales bacterium]|jgi:hypothetical protein|nr:hypothetical protein [Acidimicrobiales bacterium]